LRIQAKRLNAALSGNKPVKIAYRSYHELLHKPPQAVKFQFETLADAPAPWVPLYMFYNHQSAVDDPYFAGVKPKVSGVNLAFATDVANELKLKLNAAKAKPKSVKHHKRLSHLRGYLFGLETILCPGGDWKGAGVPTPIAVSTSFRERWAARGGGTTPTKEENIILQILSEPAKRFPGERFERPIPDGPSIRVDDTMKRPVVTFISGRTKDGRTPIITESSESRWR
jgi:hypothetical protein